MNAHTTKAEDIKHTLENASHPQKAKDLSAFFKTGVGEYGEGDLFIGVTVPTQRKIAKEYYNTLSSTELSILLSSKIHEHRLTALLILVLKYEKEQDLVERKKWVDFYLRHTQFINNWDLVDTSCYKILGNYSFETKKDDLINALADSENLWEKRIAIVSTLYFIKKGTFYLTKNIALKNLNDPHDLMHKANGWMLREMGKMDENELLVYLQLHYKKMPRTTLRYAIERLEPTIKQDFLKGKR